MKTLLLTSTLALALGFSCFAEDNSANEIKSASDFTIELAVVETPVIERSIDRIDESKLLNSEPKAVTKKPCQKPVEYLYDYGFWWTSAK